MNTSIAGWHAELALGFAHDAATERTILRERRHRGPLVVQKALHPEGATCHVIIVHPPGGIAGGDRLRIGVQLDSASHALVTTPGATRWYRSNDRPAAQAIELAVGAGACLEWLPQETIVFDDADATNALAIDLAPDATYIGWEVVCFGRRASGERMTRGRYRQRCRIVRDGKLLWDERGQFAPQGPGTRSQVAFGDATVTATLVAVAPSIASAAVDACRDAARIRMGAHAGVSRLPGGLLVARSLGGSSEEARGLMLSLWEILRPALAGKRAVTPRIWNV